MKKKKQQQQHRPSPAFAPEPAIVESEAAQAVPASVEHPTPVAATTDEPSPVNGPTRQPRVPDPRVFALTGQEFKPGKGLATALYQTLQGGAATVQQAADHLLASGEYARVAPQAAKLRPTRPVETLLKHWLAQGAVTAS